MDLEGDWVDPLFCSVAALPDLGADLFTEGSKEKLLAAVGLFLCDSLDQY
jgi:hypothetical protein